MERLADRLAHDLRNPLGSVMMALQMMDRLSTGDGVRRHLALAMREIRAMERILCSIVEAEVSKHEVISQIQLADAIATALGLCEAELRERRVSWNVSAVDGALWVRAEPARFVKAVMQLLGEAARAHPGTALQLSAKRIEGGLELVIAPGPQVSVRPSFCIEFVRVVAQELGGALVIEPSGASLRLPLVDEA